MQHVHVTHVNIHPYKLNSNNSNNKTAIPREKLQQRRWTRWSTWQEGQWATKGTCGYICSSETYKRYNLLNKLDLGEGCDIIKDPYWIWPKHGACGHGTWEMEHGAWDMGHGHKVALPAASPVFFLIFSVVQIFLKKIQKGHPPCWGCKVMAIQIHCHHSYAKVAKFEAAKSFPHMGSNKVHAGERSACPSAAAGASVKASMPSSKARTAPSTAPSSGDASLISLISMTMHWWKTFAPACTTVNRRITPSVTFLNMPLVYGGGSAVCKPWTKDEHEHTMSRSHEQSMNNIWQKKKRDLQTMNMLWTTCDKHCETKQCTINE